MSPITPSRNPIEMEQESLDTSTSSALIDARRKSNEIASPDFFLFAGHLTPILNLESPTEMSTIMKKRAAQKMNEKEVDSERVPQDLPPQMKFATLNSNDTSPNSENNYVMKKTGLSPPTSAEDSVTFCYIKNKEETARKMLFLDEAEERSPENVKENYKIERDEYPRNLLCKEKKITHTETIIAKKNPPNMNITPHGFKTTNELAIKQEDTNDLDYNSNPQSIEDIHNTCYDANKNKIDVTEKKMIVTMMQRYLDNENLEFDSTEARAFSSRNHPQKNDPMYNRMNNPMTEFDATATRDFSFRNDQWRNDQVYSYHPTYERMTNKMPEFDVKATRNFSSQNDQVDSYHPAYTQMTNEAIDQHNFSRSYEKHMLQKRPSVDNSSRNYSYDIHEQLRPRSQQFQRPQSYVPGGVEASTPDLIAYKNDHNSPTSMSDGISERICHCKKSKCLKLYCECFSASVLCDRSCSCNNCQNNEANLQTRQIAISSILARNSMAFKNKMSKAEKRAAMLNQNTSESVTTTSRGCNCRKSLCLKKYCECFFTKILCDPIRCRCIDCHNFEGSAKLFHALRKKDEHERKEYDASKRRELRYQNEETEQSFSSIEAPFDNKRLKQSNEGFATEMGNSHDANVTNGIVHLKSKPLFGSESDAEESNPPDAVSV